MSNTSQTTFPPPMDPSTSSQKKLLLKEAVLSWFILLATIQISSNVGSCRTFPENLVYFPFVFARKLLLAAAKITTTISKRATAHIVKHS